MDLELPFQIFYYATGYETLTSKRQKLERKAPLITWSICGHF